MSQRGRRIAVVACALSALALLAAPVAALFNEPERGADSPESAVKGAVDAAADGQLLDVVRFLDPQDLDDIDTLVEAFEAQPLDYTKVDNDAYLEFGDVLDIAGQQLEWGVDEDSVAALAALELDVDALELEADDTIDGMSLVHVVKGEASVELDPGRLPDSWRSELDVEDRLRHDTDLAQGWELDGDASDLVVMTVERDGRWYISLEGMRALLAGELSSDFEVGEGR
jgi:hypothetical protein